MTFGVKQYHYKSKDGKGGRTFYYITINGVQVFNVYFSEREVLEAIERIKSGGKP